MQPFLDSFDTPLLYGMTEYVGRSYSERSTNYGYGGRTSTNVVIKPKKSKDSMIVPASGHVLLAEDLGGSYGYTVVIDHGAGLRSIFYGLTALDVEPGTMSSRASCWAPAAGPLWPSYASAPCPSTRSSSGAASATG